MDIKNDIHIMEMNDKLYQRLKQSELVIHAKVESVLRQISSWKYATHEFYVPAPYQNELAGLPNGRIRKNIEEKDRLKIAGLYSFGFNAEGKILCSQEAVVPHDAEIAQWNVLQQPGEELSVMQCQFLFNRVSPVGRVPVITVTE